MTRAKPVKDFTAWIVVSAFGHPAPAFGLAFTRKKLKDACKRHNWALDNVLYRAVKVRISTRLDA
jgi:hypothetical protein